MNNLQEDHKMKKVKWNDLDKYLVAVHIASVSPRYNLLSRPRVSSGTAALLVLAAFGFIVGIVLGAM